MPARTPEELHAVIAAAFTAGDIEAFLDAYEADATLVVPPEGHRVQGREAIREALQPYFAARPAMVSEVVGVVPGDGLALTHARWTLRGTEPGGAALEQSGRGTVVSRRQPDGSWRIVLDNPLTPA